MFISDKTIIQAPFFHRTSGRHQAIVIGFKTGFCIFSFYQPLLSHLSAITFSTFHQFGLVSKLWLHPYPYVGKNDSSSLLHSKLPEGH
jgi:hypothetical protein